jgi:hypothetical protein
MLRPRCAVCFRNPRQDGSARCFDCDPTTIAPPKPRPLTRVERAAQELNAEAP